MHPLVDIYKLLCNTKSYYAKRGPTGRALYITRSQRARFLLMKASMALRYWSSALRPAAVMRYSVRGMRPEKLFSQTMYAASSNLRAWTLKLPSVADISFLRSLKVRVPAAANALRMPRRKRSWTTRSKSGAGSMCLCSLAREAASGDRRELFASSVLEDFHVEGFNAAFKLFILTPA